MKKTRIFRNPSLVLAVGCLAALFLKLSLFRQFVDGRFPLSWQGWISLDSARHLLAGDWLGPSPRLALSHLPGFSLWAAGARLLGLPLEWSIEFLRAGAGGIFVVSLRRFGVSRWVCWLLFLVVLWSPLSFQPHPPWDAQLLALPLILSAAGFYFLSLSFADSSWRGLCWFFCGLSLAAYWLSLEEAWVVPAIAAWICFWEFSCQAESLGWWKRFQAIWPGALILLSTVVVADSAIRILNRVHYGEPVLQSRSHAVSPARGPSSSHLLMASLFFRDSLKETPYSRIEIVGWASSREDKLRKVELQGPRGRVIATSTEFIDRPDVKNFLSQKLGWERAAASTGFRIFASGIFPVTERLRLIFHGQSGKPIALPLRNHMPVPSDFRYSLDSVTRTFPFDPFWTVLRGWLDLGFGALCLILVPAAGFAVAAKVKGEGPRSLDFWLFLFSVLGLGLLIDAERRDSAPIFFAGNLASPWPEFFSLLAILLLYGIFRKR